MTGIPLNSLIVIPFHLPWEWSADYVNQSAYVLAKRTTVICYLWADILTYKKLAQHPQFPKLLKRSSENLYLYTPFYFIPFRRFQFVENLNIKLNIFMLKLICSYFKIKNNLKKLVVWNFYPIIEFIENSLGQNSITLYDCADYFVGIARNKEEEKQIKEQEEILTKKAHYVFANSMVLQKHLRKWRKDITLVPQGFRVEDFEDEKNYIGKKLKAKKPIIGFAGAVNHRINYDLMLPLAHNHPEWSFIIWGPVLDKERVDEKTWKKMDELLSLKNVSTGFLKDRRKLPGIFKQFDISMIPYDITQPFNKYCYPMKLFEFFYLGLPVISTEVEELKRFPRYVKIGSNYKEWEKYISGLLKNGWPKEYRKEQKRLAIENSWENKVNSILNVLSETSPQKVKRISH